MKYFIIYCIVAIITETISTIIAWRNFKAKKESYQLVLQLVSAVKQKIGQKWYKTPIKTYVIFIVVPPLAILASILMSPLSIVIKISKLFKAKQPPKVDIGKADNEIVEEFVKDTTENIDLLDAIKHERSIFSITNPYDKIKPVRLLYRDKELHSLPHLSALKVEIELLSGSYNIPKKINLIRLKSANKLQLLQIIELISESHNNGNTHTQPLFTSSLPIYTSKRGNFIVDIPVSWCLKKNGCIKLKILPKTSLEIIIC